MNLFITWNVNPEIFSIGGFSIRWYSLMFVFSFYFGYLIVSRMLKKEGVAEKMFDKLLTWMVIATIVGARLGHVLFYQPDYYLKHPLEILLIWEGGLASHGAAIGITIALWWFARKEKIDFWLLADRIVIAVALAGFFIRMGNLFNSEVFGRPTTLPWGFIFTSVDSIPRHPSQLYEALAYLLIFFFLFWYYHKKQRKPERGVLFGWFLILIFGVRIIIEFLKEPQVDFEQTMSFNMGQILSIPLVIAGMYFVLRKKE